MKRFVVVALATLLVVTSPAHAASTVLNDPVGDATICHTLRSYQEPACPYADPLLDSDPTVDMTSFEIGTSASADVVVKITVLDLDEWLTGSRKETGYSVRIHSTDFSIQLGFDAHRFGDATAGYVNIGGTNGGSNMLTPVTFDPVTNTIQWEISYARLNQLLDAACSACTDFAVGTTFTHFIVWASHLVENRVHRHADHIDGPAATYDLGD